MLKNKVWLYIMTDKTEDRALAQNDLQQPRHGRRNQQDGLLVFRCDYLHLYCNAHVPFPQEDGGFLRFDFIYLLVCSGLSN